MTNPPINEPRGPHDPALLSSDDRARFAFGDNWLRYVGAIDDSPIRHAEQSIRELLNVETLNGLRFLDVGSGSGLFSLAARRLGADVSSFDFDGNSVTATRQVKDRYRPGDSGWSIQQGSVLDARFLEGLGTYDVVYSWGVLHHTGDMWRALQNVTGLVNATGRLCIAIYNDQGRTSDVWRVIKKTYNRLPPSMRPIVFWPAFVRLWGPTLMRDLVHGRPTRTWSSYKSERGMSPMIDVKDWVGGYPFEVATPDALIGFFAQRQFSLSNSVLRSGIGCNEFAFVRAGAGSDALALAAASSGARG